MKGKKERQTRTDNGADDNRQAGVFRAIGDFVRSGAHVLQKTKAFELFTRRTLGDRHVSTVAGPQGICLVVVDVMKVPTEAVGDVGFVERVPIVCRVPCPPTPLPLLRPL